MERRPQNALSRPLVLLVEEHEDTRAMYALALSFSGFEVVAAQDIGEACRRASEIVPDIIVVDLPMPDGDGWQLLQDLKHHPRIRGVPMVATSGYVQRSMQERVERDGFAAFVAKPCLPATWRWAFVECWIAPLVSKRGSERRPGRLHHEHLPRPAGDGAHSR
jgi:CheY-like chemotaxis protein